MVFESMNIDSEIRLQLGERTGREFEGYWNLEFRSTGASGVPQAKFTPEKRRASGFELGFPAEVVLPLGQIVRFLQSDLGKELVKGLGAGLSEGLGTLAAKFVWDKLRQFFIAHPKEKDPPTVVIVFNNQRIIVDPSHMESSPPRDLEISLSAFVERK
jgi:hypothetical protein